MIDKDILLKQQAKQKDSFIKKLKADIEKMYEEEFKLRKENEELRKRLKNLLWHSEPDESRWNYMSAIELAQEILKEKTNDIQSNELSQKENSTSVLDAGLPLRFKR